MIRTILLCLGFAVLGANSVSASDLTPFLENSCLTCHDSATKSGRLDLSTLKFEPGDARNQAVWVKVWERVQAGEMPPKKADQPTTQERQQFTTQLAAKLTQVETGRWAKEGRATRRRLNRHEYENTLRDLLHAPWLALKEDLPEDAIAHGYNKIGDALDVSHVQVSRYLHAADKALREVIAHQVQRPPQQSVRYYARDMGSFTRKMFYSPFNSAPERATFPTLGFAGQPDVRSGKAPMTVGAADPKTRELEGVGLVCGAYEPVEPKFDRFKAPVAGRYRLRFMAHTVWVGPNGHPNNSKKVHWSIPNLDDISRGRRSEPVTIYSEMVPRLLRRLGAFDVSPEPAIHELEVDLLQTETIRPDASRLFRSRPGSVRWINPLAQEDGQPGVVYRWLEVEGPLYDQWPPAGHLLLFGGLPVHRLSDKIVVQPRDAKEDAPRLLANFARQVYRRPVSDVEALRFLPVIEGQLQAGASFMDAMIAGYTAVLCSPEFITINEQPGKLDDFALASRLSYFLWNSTPDAELRQLAARGELHKPEVLKAQTQRLLNDPRSSRFVNAFLDYWLDLRKILANSPDATLYNDYYLDDLLTDSALEETQQFFRELLRSDLPARNLIDSDFVMINERLATHYGIPGVDGVDIRKVKLPTGHVRGGLLTQASVLTVTANGTTTSPVLRGAWIMERILGQPAPPPPPVPAVEPDLRGAVTIREQLARHRDQASCAVCHSKIDPPGFALENFDVMGGWRDRYRAIAEPGQRIKGYGKSGQPFEFRYGLPVDASGELASGKPFHNIRDFKKLLLEDERQIARNLVQQLSIYATGAPLGFSDRARIESILNLTQEQGYRVSSLIHALVQSELFRNK